MNKLNEHMKLRVQNAIKQHKYIETKRLFLMPLEVSDAAEAFKWCGDAQATKYMTFSTYTDVAAIRDWIFSQQSDDSLFGIFLKNGALIGSIGCPLLADGSARNLGYCINRNYWGRGYGTEAAKALLAYCALKFVATDFFVQHAVENVGSQRVIEKCGFVFEKTGSYEKADGSRTFSSMEYSLHVGIHRMNLCAEPFEKIVDGTKTVEMRLDDERRQNIRVGDYIAFTHLGNGQIALARVLALHRFGSFAQFYENMDLTKCGYSAEEAATASPDDMLQYYTREQLSNYGALGIELEFCAKMQGFAA